MGLDDYVEGLAHEALTDMAESFFGARKRLEEDLEDYRGVLAALREREREAVDKGCFLNFLLNRGWAVDGFYRALGVDPDAVSCFSRCDMKKSYSGTPFALSSAGKYAKSLVRAYGVFQRACADYMDGVYEQDVPGGRKRLSVHWGQAHRLCLELAERVRKVNAELSPVCALQYVKSLDPAAMERENVTGATFGGAACSLDEKLAFRPPSLAEMERMRLPDLPPEDEVRDTIMEFGRNLYAEHTDEIKRLMTEVES